MQIKRVSIENFRCFGSKIELNFQKLHALIGENGAGKTAILEAINFATSKEYAARRITEQDFNNKDSGMIVIEISFDSYFVAHLKDGYLTRNVLCEGVILRIKRRDKGSPGKALSDGYAISHLVKPVEYLNVNVLDEAFFPSSITKAMIPPNMKKTTEGYQAQRVNRSWWDISPQNSSINNDLLGYPSIFYFDRNREMEAKSGYNSLFQKITRELNWRYRKDADLISGISKWEPYYNSVIETVEDEKKTKILSPLKDDLKKIIGRNMNNLEISILNLEQPFNHAFFSLRNSSETNQIIFENFGSGISTLVAFLLLRVISKMSKEKIIFLIDEPEMHLHPQAQQNLFLEFSKADYQIIYTTHTDRFVRLKEWSSITRFSNKFEYSPKTAILETINEGKKISEHLDEIKTWHSDETIFSTENNELFFANKLLLVEGPAEKYGFPRIAQLLGKSINDITIISCNGKNKIPYYQLISKAFSIPYMTIFDLDNKSVEDAENKKIINWVEDDNKYTFTSSFETLLGVNPSSNHKGSETLIKIDLLTAGTIPNEIKEAVKKICDWRI